MSYKFVNGKEISLWQGIFDFEHFGEVINCAMGTFQGETGLVLEASRGINTNRNTLALVFALRHCFNVIEVTDSPCQ